MDTEVSRIQWGKPRTTDAWWLDPKFLTEWLINEKPCFYRCTVTKFVLIVKANIVPQIPHNFFGRSVQKGPNILDIFEKKLSSGVRSPWGKQKSLITTDKGPHSGVSRQFQSKESSKNSNLFSLLRLYFLLCSFPQMLIGNFGTLFITLTFLGNLSFY